MTPTLPLLMTSSRNRRALALFSWVPMARLRLLRDQIETGLLPTVGARKRLIHKRLGRPRAHNSSRVVSADGDTALGYSGFAETKRFRRGPRPRTRRRGGAR